jgi:hypothetical protein
MNKFFRLFLMSTMAFTVFACGEDEEPAPVVELSINAADKTQAFDETGGSKTIVVVASGAFTAISDQTWCTISGLTQSLFKIEVAANTTTEARTAKVTVALTGATSIEIAVSQAATPEVVLPPAILMAQPLMFHFDTPVAGLKYATITTNREDYDVIVNADWVTTEKTADQLDQLLLKIMVAESKVEAEREATVTIHVDGATDVVLHVSQAAYIPPVVAPNATAKWNVAAPGNIEWYKWAANKTIGTPAGAAPATVEGPGGVQAWACATEDHFKITNPLTVPTTVYTLLWDVRIATLGTPKYRPLLQTKEDNNDGDADVFISNNQIGLGSYSQNVLVNDTWHRIIVVVNVDAATEAKSALFYVDGQPVLTKSITSAGDIDRYTLQTIFWIFLDDDNEDGPIDCAGVALWNKTLSAAEILSLGNPTTSVN